MMMSDGLDPAWVLHSRAYRDTSLMVDLFTLTEGRFTAIVKGARSKKPRFRGNIQPFFPLLISCFGKHELKTVKQVEFQQPAPQLHGHHLYVGMYVNELLYRLLGKFDPSPLLFDAYQALLYQLPSSEFSEGELRHFEFCLMTELGYGLTFDFDALTGEMIDPDKTYRFVADQGFVEFHGVAESFSVYNGSHLLAIASGNFTDKGTLVSAKKITRMALNQLMGGRPLKSRELFKNFSEAS